MPGEQIANLLTYSIVFVIFFVIAVELEGLLFKVCDFLNNKAWDTFFSLPEKLYNATLGRLFSWISKKLSKTGMNRLDMTLASKGFGGIRSLTWVIISLVYIAVELIRTPSAGQDLLMNIVTGTAIGAPVAFLIGEVSLSLPVLIGAGFTRFLTTEAMRQHNDDDDEPADKQHPRQPRREMHLVVKCIFGLIFLCAFGLLGNAMSGIFESISATINSLADKIANLPLFVGTAGFWDWFYLVVGGTGFIVAGYLWLLLVFMAIKEYVSNYSYCLLPMCVLLFFLMILSAFGLDKLDWLVAIFLVIATLVGEWHRYQMEHDDVKRKKYLDAMGRFRFISNHFRDRNKGRRTRRPFSPCSSFRFRR